MEIKNQFKHHLVTQEEQNEFVSHEETGSFNVFNVMRTVEYKKDCIVVLLNDGHEHTFEEPQFSNTGKQKNTIRVKKWVTSEIFLNEEDSKKYRELTTV